MKYIIFFVLYISDTDTVAMKGVVALNDTIAYTYLYPFTYLEWKIKAKELVVQNKVVLNGIVYMERNNVTSTLVITPREITQTIFTDQWITIRMRRKRR